MSEWLLQTLVHQALNDGRERVCANVASVDGHMWKLVEADGKRERAHVNTSVSPSLFHHRMACSDELHVDDSMGKVRSHVMSHVCQA